MLNFLRTEILPDMRAAPPEDMDEMTLQSLEELSLAQAQECFWQKAVKDGLKDGSIAKLAAKVSDFYSQAGDYGIKSDAISTEWIHHMTAKHHHFAAAAQYRQSRDCMEKRKYGEEVARLRDSVNCVNEALKESRWINRTVLGDLNGLKNRVSEDLKRAEKDNDVIYLLPVPPKSELKTLDRASMVVAKPPKEVSDGIAMLHEGGPFGAPLFARLVPYAVHMAASVYGERRDRLVNQSIIADLEAMTSKLRDLLQSLGQPGILQASEKPMGIPPSLISKAEEIRQQDGLNRLHRTIEDTKKLKSNDRAIYEQGVELLRTEKAEDEQARAKHGTVRWTRQPSEIVGETLHMQVKDIEGYLNSAQSSDDLVQGKLRDSERVLRVLNGTSRDLESYVPSSRSVTQSPQMEREKGRVRTCVNEVGRIESRRKRKIEALKDKARSDDIGKMPFHCVFTLMLTIPGPALRKETGRLEREFPMQKIDPLQFNDLFDERLKYYDPDKVMLSEESEDQNQLSERLKEANAAFLAARKGDTSTKEREKALQDLENGYIKYKEIVSNLDVGRKFYNDLAKIVGRFRDDCKNFVHQRQMEAAQLEACVVQSDSSSLTDLFSNRDLTNSAMSSMNLGQTTSSLQQQKHQEHHRPPPPRSMGHEPLAAPLPTRANPGPPMPVPGMWTPEVGIKFGGPPPQAHGNPHVAPYPQTRPDHQWDPKNGVRFS